ncbi:unnamed protein product [Adineta ricciae]|uniref:Uncharacterized protein n=1 Tax=Adineta ricciae TaxID=249248 RepID=A0A813WDJ6_ADIRI|nr:unnamed protein product [Adineta ricciae]
MYNLNSEILDFLHDYPFGEDIVDSLQPLSEQYRGERVDKPPFSDLDEKEELDFLDAYTDPHEKPTELPVLHTNVVVANHQNIYRYLSDTNASLSNIYGLKNSEYENQSNENPAVVPPTIDFEKIHGANISSRKIAIVHKLEDRFRLRYKSDYFSLYGRKRKPRYVADELNNHFVALEIADGLQGYIQVDWLTVVDKYGRRYRMPYKFQEDNDNVNVPDVNPLQLKIKEVKNGIMKLYLVLIKAKQDHLKHLQPLVPFEPYRNAIDPAISTNVQGYAPLNPKELIQTYQLEKSQLAFTYCSIAADGKTRIPEWDTTVFSSILHEVHTRNSKRKPVKRIEHACPRCGHHFQTQPKQDSEDSASDDETSTDSPTTRSLKRKSN